MFKKSLMVTVIMCVGCTLVYALESARVNPKAQSVREAVPLKAWRLSIWPEQTTLSGSNRIKANNKERNVVTARKHASRWIKRVLAPACRPESEKEILKALILLHDEFDSFDTVRAQWIRDGCRIEVSQTLFVMTIKCTPLEERALGQNLSEKTSFARQCCMKLFNPNGQRSGLDRNKKPVIVPVKNINAFIAENSFRGDLTFEFGDGVVGLVPDITNSPDIVLSQRGKDRKAENSADNPKWQESLPSWGYWWRHVSCWDDGKSVVFFLLKNNAGPIQASYYYETSDVKKWF